MHDVGAEVLEQTLQAGHASGRDPHVGVHRQRPRRDRDDPRAMDLDRHHARSAVRHDHQDVVTATFEVLQHVQDRRDHSIGLREERLSDDGNPHDTHVRGDV